MFGPISYLLIYLATFSPPPFPLFLLAKIRARSNYVGGKEKRSKNLNIRHKKPAVRKIELHTKEEERRKMSSLLSIFPATYINPALPSSILISKENPHERTM
jgi:hypothetical protein